MSKWTIIFEKRSLKDARLLRRTKLWKRTSDLLDILRSHPFQTPPPYEKLGGEFRGMYSRRINVHHRLVYDVRKDEKIVRILQMWTHYE
ncbi:MAG: Txe/YoeB family addiction module toxin [Pyrinomonadaceae bacterium]|nr:Txe/YoeB family addiction module toxin [Blastocatellia bacterium]MDQ3221515.1 Txe/YoeB family addiction module toxin [Acidobacteriota bacterium]